MIGQQEEPVRYRVDPFSFGREAGAVHHASGDTLSDADPMAAVLGESPYRLEVVRALTIILIGVERGRIWMGAWVAHGTDWCQQYRRGFEYGYRIAVDQEDR
jgi:hypothetical protein